MRWRPTRRQLIRTGLIALIPLELYYFKDWLGGFSPWQLASWRLRALELAASPERPKVAISAVPSYGADVLGALRSGWALAGLPDERVKGRRVVLKVNLAWSLDGHPISTAPEVVSAAVRLFRELGASEVLVADGPTFTDDIDLLLARTGVGKVLTDLGVRFVDLNRDDLVLRPLVGGYSTIGSLWAPKTIADAGLLVSMPKLKTHHWTTVSLSLKNLFGIVPGSRYGWPKNILHWHSITLSILALQATFKPGFAIVDGVVGMEGDGPVLGTPIESGLVVMGADGVAVDTVAAAAMGIAASEVDHLRFAGFTGLGVSDLSRIEVVGSSLASVRRQFKRAPAVETFAG